MRDGDRALDDMEMGHMQFRLNCKQVNFNVSQSKQQLKNMRVVSVIDIDDDVETMPIEDFLEVEALAMVIMNFHSDGINEFADISNLLHGRGFYNNDLKKLYLDLKN